MRIQNFFKNSISPKNEVENNFILLKNNILKNILPEPTNGYKIVRKKQLPKNEYFETYVDEKEQKIYLIYKHMVSSVNLSDFGNFKNILSYESNFPIQPLTDDYEYWISRVSYNNNNNFKYNIYNLKTKKLIKTIQQGGENPKGNCCNFDLFHVVYTDYKNNYLEFITNYSYNGDYRLVNLNLNTGEVSTIYQISNSGQLDTFFAIKIKNKTYFNRGYKCNHFEVRVYNHKLHLEEKPISYSIGCVRDNPLRIISFSENQLILGNTSSWGHSYNNIFYIDLETKNVKVLNLFDKNNNLIQLGNSNYFFNSKNNILSNKNFIVGMFLNSKYYLVELESV